MYQQPNFVIIQTRRDVEKRKEEQTVSAPRRTGVKLQLPVPGTGRKEAVGTSCLLKGVDKGGFEMVAVVPCAA